MASYVVIRGSEQGVGNSDLYGLVIDDGTTMLVVGDSDVAVDLRDGVDLAEGGNAEERLQSVLTGLSYFDLQGPIPFEGSSEDAVAPLAALYGLR